LGFLVPIFSSFCFLFRFLLLWTGLCLDEKPGKKSSRDPFLDAYNLAICSTKVNLLQISRYRTMTTEITKWIHADGNIGRSRWESLRVKSRYMSSKGENLDVKDSRSDTDEVWELSRARFAEE
jgi:hypothetical protein